MHITLTKLDDKEEKDGKAERKVDWVRHDGSRMNVNTLKRQTKKWIATSESQVVREGNLNRKRRTWNEKGGRGKQKRAAALQEGAREREREREQKREAKESEGASERMSP